MSFEQNNHVVCIDDTNQIHEGAKLVHGRTYVVSHVEPFFQDVQVLYLVGFEDGFRSLRFKKVGS